MAQIRVEKRDHYTRIDNDLIQNPDISLKAKGLMAYMLSVPDDWDYSIAGLSVKCKEGKSSIRSAIMELMEHGYITRSLARKGNGTIDGYEYVVYEVPPPSCEKPTTDKPSTENPSSENRTQQINNLTNEKRTNTPYSPPAGGGAPEPEGKPKPKPKGTKQEKSVPAYDPVAFEELWKIYPRKDSRKAATRAWDKLKPDRPLCRVMFFAIKRQQRSEQWSKEKGQFVPYFSTWLNGRQWENGGVDLSLLSGPREPPEATGGWLPDPEKPS